MVGRWGDGGHQVHGEYADGQRGCETTTAGGACAEFAGSAKSGRDQCGAGLDKAETWNRASLSMKAQAVDIEQQAPQSIQPPTDQPSPDLEAQGDQS